MLAPKTTAGGLLRLRSPARRHHMLDRNAGSSFLQFSLWWWAEDGRAGPKWPETSGKLTTELLSLLSHSDGLWPNFDPCFSQRVATHMVASTIPHVHFANHKVRN